MNIFYIYVLFIAIYFSLCQMSYEEIELNFGDDNSNKMLIRTINEVNSTELSKTDILSDQLYMYDKEFNRVIFVANDSNIYKPESLLK